MANESGEGNSILRELLLSDDEPSDRQVPQNSGNGNKRTSGWSPYPGRAKVSRQDEPRLEDEVSNNQQMENAQNAPRARIILPKFEEYHQKMVLIGLEAEYESTDDESDYGGDFPSDNNNNNNNAQYYIDDLPETIEMTNQYYAQLRKKVSDDAIGLPTE